MNLGRSDPPPLIKGLFVFPLKTTFSSHRTKNVFVSQAPCQPGFLLPSCKKMTIVPPSWSLAKQIYY